MVADFMSPKAIANRIKAKGLQKLRWYCQMCEKQCRDENGFKCHLTSESHKRKMEIFGQNPHKVIDDFSQEFETSFLDHLRRTHPFSRVGANVVYNEFIQDRNHVHMNATRWVTLTEFVKHLGREGKCKVEETPKGWYITLIQKDPFDEMEKKKKREREKSEKEADARHLKVLQAQAERAKQARMEQEEDQGIQGQDQSGNLELETRKDPLRLSIGNFGQKKTEHRKVGIAFEDEQKQVGDDQTGMDRGSKKSKVEQLMEKELSYKKGKMFQNEANADSEAWLLPNIVVKVMSASLKEQGYYKKKGVVIKVLDKFLGEIEMLGSGDVLRIDQDELETVIPAPGKRVKIVKGVRRGQKGVLQSLQEAKFGGMVQIEGESEPIFLEYEYFSKM